MSVASSDDMPDRRKSSHKRRHRERAPESSDSDNGQDGRRRPRQQAPRVPFEPRYCGQCAPENRRTRYATRSSLTKHSVLNPFVTAAYPPAVLAHVKNKKFTKKMLNYVFLSNRT